MRPLQPLHGWSRRRRLLVRGAGDRLIPPVDAERLAAATRAQLWATMSEGHGGSHRAEPAAHTERALGLFVVARGLIGAEIAFY